MRKPMTLLIAACMALLFASVRARAEEAPAHHQGRDAQSWAGDLAAEGIAARRQAVYALWHLGPASRPHVRALAKALRDDDEYVRTIAEQVLGRFEFRQAIGGLPPAMPELIEALADERPAVRFAAVKLIWAAGPLPNVVGGDPPPDTLLPALDRALGDADPGVRANAAAALANLRDAARAAVPALLACLSDAEGDVRMWSVRALSSIDGRGTFDAVSALARDDVAGVRTAVLEAAGAASPEQAAKALEVLMAAVEDPGVEVRRAAVSGLWSLGRVEALPTLAGVLKDDADPALRALAGQALGGLGDPAAVGALMAALEGADEVTRLGAAGGISRLGPEGAVALPRLVEMLASGSDAQRRSIAMALGQLAPWSAPALSALRAALKDENPSVRAMAASSLSVLARHDVLDDATLEAVVAALADTEVQVLQYAVPMVAAVGGRAVAAVPALIDLHARDVPGLGRLAVLYALQGIGPAAGAALPALRAAVAAEGDDRLAAAAALACVSEDAMEIDGAVQLLIDALADERERSIAFYRLKMVGVRARRAALIMRVWMKSGEDWRYLAAAALLRMEGGAAADAVDVLAAGLRSETPARAIRALDDVGAEGRGLIPVLLEIAGEAGHAYRTGALGALGRFGARGEAVRATYAKARQDGNPWIRSLGQQGLHTLDAASEGAR